MHAANKSGKLELAFVSVRNNSSQTVGDNNILANFALFGPWTAVKGPVVYLNEWIKCDALCTWFYDVFDTLNNVLAEGEGPATPRFIE